MCISKINTSTTIRTFIAVLATTVLFTGCKDDSSGPDDEDHYLQVTSTQSHGNVLADAEGNILYFFAPDVRGESKCAGDCIANWPVFSTEELMPGNGLQPDDMDEITRADGSSQTTFKGWPLYYFAGDNQPGDINGDGANGVWFVAKPDYSLMVASEQLVGEDGNNYTSNYEQGEENTTFFTDTDGRTIYIFSFDEANTNNFTAEDFSNNGVWPLFHTDLQALPSAMNEDDFGVITVHDQEQQLTYKGWPLYYFGQDTERGDTKGVSFPEPGIWPIVNTDTPEAP